MVTKALKSLKLPLIRDRLDYNKIGRNDGDETNLNNFKYRWQCISLGIVAGSLLLTACQTVPTIEIDDSNQVIQQEFTQSAVPLTNELNDYNLIDEFYTEDEADNAVEQAVLRYLKNDLEIKNHKLDLDSMDLKLFTSEEGDVYFLALLLDKRQAPNTLFGKLKKTPEGTYAPIGEHLASYMVNIPKTYLLEKAGDWVLVSQRPFSTFEECYFFKMEDGKLTLYKRGWQDPSLLYYSTMTALLEAGKIAEAMALPDDSMYPMGYEQPLFETANLMVETAENQALKLEDSGETATAITYLDWSLNYYFQNHYGTDLTAMIQEGFEPLKNASADDFGGSYVLDSAYIKKVLLHYANLLGKAGDEKGAESYKKAIETAFPKQ